MFMLCWLDNPDSHWTEYCWCDGVFIDEVVAPARDVLEVVGSALWGPGGADFIDPLFVSIQLTEDRSALLSIEVNLGDANLARPPEFRASKFSDGYLLPTEWRSWFKFIAEDSLGAVEE